MNWLTERAGPDELTDTDFDATGPLPPLSNPAVVLPKVSTGRHPAHPDLPTSPETTKSRPIKVIGRDFVIRLRANS
ncbi:hypothetical protein [Streptomyces sp. NPDC126933]|uniref:hypothetical protein n=1 Tax=unclassified Streptomyces TaxID=2593676 RepID=UPI003663EF1C